MTTVKLCLFAKLIYEASSIFKSKLSFKRYNYLLDKIHSKMSDTNMRNGGIESK